MAEFRIGEAFISVTARDNTAADEARIRSRWSRVRASVQIDADTKAAEAKIRAVEAKLAALRSKKQTVEVQAQTAQAEANLVRLKSNLASLNDKRVKVDVDVSQGTAGLRSLNVSGLRTIGVLGGIGAAAGAAGAAIAAMPALGAAAGGIFGVLAGSLSGVGDALKGYTADQDAAAKASGASGSAAAGNARQIRDAQQSIADARRNQARAADDATEQIDAAERQQQRVARDTRDAINDAKRDEQRVAEDVADSVAAARAAQAEAEDRAADSITAASDRVQDALDDERKAQDDLTDARAAAQQQLDDLAETVRDYALDQEGAAIRVLKAEAARDKVMADSTATATEKREADYDLAVAMERVRDLTREQQRDTAELTKAQAAGIAGSDLVVSAQERLTDAQGASADAQKALVEAQSEGRKATLSAAAAVTKAITDGAERQQAAAENTARVERDAADQRADAERAVTEAKESAGQAQEDAARAVAQALQGLEDVQASQAESALAGAAASSQYADAMAKLSPAAQDFVRQLIAMKPLVDGLKRASSESFLPGLTQMLKDSEGLFPIFEEHLRRTGTIMGDTARQFGALFKSEEFKKNLDALFKASEPITKALGDGLVRLVDKLVEFGAKMAPAAEGFATFVSKTMGGLEKFFDTLAPHSETFKRIWESLGRVMEVLLPVIAEIIVKLAEHLAPALEKLAGFLERNKDKLDEWALALGGFLVVLKGAKVVSDVTKWTSSVVGLLDGVGKSADTNRGKVDKLLKKLKKPALKGAGVLVAGAVVGAVAPGSSDDPDTGNLGQDTANDIGGAIEQLASFDFAGIWAEIGDEFANSNVPAIGRWFSELPGKIGGWLAPLPGVVGGWFASLPGIVGGKFTELKDTALGKLDELKVWAGTKASEAVTSVSTFFSELPGKVGGWFGGMKDTALGKLDELRDWAGVKSGEIRDKIQGFIAGIPGWFRDRFTEAKEWSLQKLTEFRDWAGTKAQELRDKIQGFIAGIPGWIRDRFGEAKDWALQKLTEFRDWAGTKTQELRDRIQGFIAGIPGWIRDRFNEAKDWALGKLNELRDWAGTKVRELKDKIVGGIEALPGQVRDVFGRVKDWALQKLNELRDAAGAPIRFVVDTVYNNGIKPAWNSIASVFNMPRLATGGIMPGYTPGRDVHLAALSGGEAVMRPEWTRAAGEGYINGANKAARIGGVQGAAGFIQQNGLPGYAGGGIVGDVWDKVSGFTSGLFTDAAGAVRSLFSGALGDNNRTPGAPSMWKDAAKKPAPRVVDAVLAKATAWAKNALSVGEVGGSGVQRWAGVAQTALSMMGQSGALVPTVLRRMNQESGGNPTVVNRWDSNWLRGTPSVGLMQVIGPTYRANRDARRDVGPYLYGTSIDPLSNVLSSMHYALGRYGSLPAAYNKAGGYDQGGIAQGVGMLPKYTPEPERVLSPQQTESFDRLVDWMTRTGTTPGGSDRPVNLYVQQTSGSPAETGRFVALALRGVG